MLQKEEVVFVTEHRLMESQLRRHFVGRVRGTTEHADGGLVETDGRDFELNVSEFSNLR